MAPSIGAGYRCRLYLLNEKIMPESGDGDSDLYISFRQGDGSWGMAFNLGDKVNTSAREASASVTPDGKYLFFNRTVSPGNGDIFWVDAQIIESLRPKK